MKIARRWNERWVFRQMTWIPIHLRLLSRRLMFVFVRCKLILTIAVYNALQNLHKWQHDL